MLQMSYLSVAFFPVNVVVVLCTVHFIWSYFINHNRFVNSVRLQIPGLAYTLDCWASAKSLGQGAISLSNILILYDGSCTGN
jgi:hypothetical protein